jgi:hypothetical protein
MMKQALLMAIFLGMSFVTQCASAQQYPEEMPRPPGDEGNIDTAPPDSSPDSAASQPKTITESLPYSPYPAGLSWVLTPQAFRVPIPNRIYYPPATYVRRCPYYPRGYYWGANWRFNVVGRGNLLFMGPYRYNPYLTAAKAQHDPKLRGQRRYAPPPGPVGQAMLLGSAGPSGNALPPTVAKNDGPDHDETEAQVAAVQKAPERNSVHPASSRRTAKKPDQQDQDLR